MVAFKLHKLLNLYIYTQTHIEPLIYSLKNEW